MKRLFALMLALLVAATMMVACNNNALTTSSENGADDAADVPADVQTDEVAEPEVEDAEVTEPEVEDAEVTEPEVEDAEVTEADGEIVLTADQQVYFDAMRGGFASSIESSTNGLCQGDVVIDGTTIKLYCTYKLPFSDEELAQMRATMETSIPELKESLSPFAGMVMEQIPAITSVVVVYNDISGAEIVSFEL